MTKNKKRTVLTVLGVVIGIVAVTTMVSIGQSADSLVQGQFEALGTNVIVVILERVLKLNADSIYALGSSYVTRPFANQEFTLPLGESGSQARRGLVGRRPGRYRVRPSQGRVK